MQRLFIIIIMLEALLTINAYKKTEHSSGAKEVHLEQQVINRLIMSGYKDTSLVLPEDTLLEDTYVKETYGDAELAEWVKVYNEDMMYEYVLGNWKPACVQLDDKYYKYDKDLIGEISAKVTRNGITYVIGSTVVKEPVSCRLSGPKIVTETGLEFNLTDYGCMTFTCDECTIILSKEK